jgi:hypothetical protein
MLVKLTIGVSNGIDMSKTFERKGGKRNLFPLLTLV